MQNKLNKIIKNRSVFREIKYFAKRMSRPKWLYFLSNTTKSISQKYGIERGKPIDRFYIENFLETNSNLIHGRCLELLNNEYTLRYGKDIVVSDVLDIDEKNTSATIHGDIKKLTGKINDDTYDCIILTQVLQFIDDYDTAILECRRILKPGGHVLITAPAMSRIDCVAGQDGDYWRFTRASMQFILQNKFKNIKVNSHGNAKIGMGFWLGLSQQDIPRAYYKNDDSNFPILITAIAQK